MLTATTGALWSSWTITVRPLSSVKVVVRDRHLLDERGDRAPCGNGAAGSGEVGAARLQGSAQAAQRTHGLQFPEKRLS